MSAKGLLGGIASYSGSIWGTLGMSDSVGYLLVTVTAVAAIAVIVNVILIWRRGASSAGFPTEV
jgi:hypothetical protein